MPTVKQPTLTLGDRLRRTRLDAELTTTEMAELMFMSRNIVNNWEKDQNRPPARRLRQWAEVIARHSDYTADDVVTFLREAPVSLAERRRNNRRTSSHQPSRSDMWITATRTVEERSVTNLRAA